MSKFVDELGVQDPSRPGCPDLQLSESFLICSILDVVQYPFVAEGDFSCGLGCFSMRTGTIVGTVDTWW